MNTKHNYVFCEEIRKISIISDEKSTLSVALRNVKLCLHYTI